jgi:GNAT superfamily N-acetyltransferase
MTDAVHIKALEATDVERMLPLVEQYWRFEAIEGFDAGKIATLLSRVVADPSLGQAWLAIAGNQAVGYLLAVYVFSLEHRGLTAEIDELFVVPAYRGQGLGGRLLEVAEHGFRIRGCTNVFLQVGRDNEQARAFYRSRGFSDRIGFDMVDKDLE